MSVIRKEEQTQKNSRIVLTGDEAEVVQGAAETGKKQLPLKRPARREERMEKKEEKIEIIDLYAQHVYANLISFNVNPEEICLGMGIRDVKEPDPGQHPHLRPHDHPPFPALRRHGQQAGGPADRKRGHRPRTRAVSGSAASDALQFFLSRK